MLFLQNGGGWLAGVLRGGSLAEGLRVVYMQGAGFSLESAGSLLGLCVCVACVCVWHDTAIRNEAHSIQSKLHDMGEPETF